MFGSLTSYAGPKMLSIVMQEMFAGSFKGQNERDLVDVHAEYITNNNVRVMMLHAMQGMTIDSASQSRADKSVSQLIFYVSLFGVYCIRHW